MEENVQDKEDERIKRIVNDPDMYVLQTRLHTRMIDGGASYRRANYGRPKAELTEEDRLIRSFFGYKVRHAICEIILDEDLDDREKVYKMGKLMLRSFD